MVSVRVKSKWQGQVAIRDKYIEQVKKDGEGLVIKLGEDKMTLPFGTIKAAIKGRSTKAFFDRFSNSSHYLIYFDWKPDERKQKTLFN